MSGTAKTKRVKRLSARMSAHAKPAGAMVRTCSPHNLTAPPATGLGNGMDREGKERRGSNAVV